MESHSISEEERGRGFSQILPLFFFDLSCVVGVGGREVVRYGLGLILSIIFIIRRCYYFKISMGTSIKSLNQLLGVS